PPAAATTGRRGGGSPADRATSTREFLGLGPAPDPAAAARGAVTFQANCSFCHGANARGAEGPNLILSKVVLSDEKGSVLVPFLKKGLPDKGMPAFTGFTDDQLRDVAEFVHQKVEDVANRGTYKVLNILVGDVAKGKTYFTANCATCHAVDKDLAGIGAKYSPTELQRNWINPPRGPAEGSRAVTAVVTTAKGQVSGRVTQIDDFRIVLVDAAGTTQTVAIDKSVKVALKDPLQPHQDMIPSLKDDDIHNVTAYLETLK
ncbi:MAG: cytochrome c, class, partial [Caulobacter sp.]|nr:cytochrome c, class [Caulobacter sp.]